MPEQAFPLGPPFAGMTDDWDTSTPQVLLLDGLLPDSGGLLSAPPLVTMETGRPCQRGGYVTGWKEKAIFITIGTDASNDIIYTATRGSTTVVSNLTEGFGEHPKRPQPYKFATLGGKVYFAGGQQVFEVDANSLEPSQMLCETGRESGVIPYIIGRIPARDLVVHNDCMFFALAETVDFPTDFEVDASDPYVTAQANIQTNGMIRYTTGMYMFSDPYEPNHVKFYNGFTIDDDGCEVVALADWNSGLLVLTNKSAWFLGGDSVDTWVHSKLSGYAGCVAPASVAVIGNQVWWADVYNIWCADPSEGVKAVPGITKMLRDYIAWGESQYMSSGAPFLGGRYYAVSLYAPNSQSNVIVVECATGATAFLDDGVDVLCGCDSEGVFDGGGMLAMTGSIVSAYFNDGTGGSRDCIAEWRVNLDRVNERTATRLVASFNLTPASAEARAIGLMDLQRITSSGASATYPLVDITTYSTTMTPPIGEEGSRWDHFSWVATPAPAGSVTPRWAMKMPCIFDAPLEARGRDVCIDLHFTVRRATRLEEATLVIGEVS